MYAEVADRGQLDVLVEGVEAEEEKNRLASTPLLFAMISPG